VTRKLSAAEIATRDQLLELLRHALTQAGNASFITAELMDTLVDHSAGNYRSLISMGASSWPTAWHTSWLSSMRSAAWSCFNPGTLVACSRRK
jgi:hypothetical protein